MAKKTAIQATETQGTSALAAPSKPQEIGFVDGLDKDDMVTPRAHLFQGTTSERNVFPDADPGDLINCVSGEKIESKKFLVLHGFKDYAEMDGMDVVKVSQDRAEWPEDMHSTKDNRDGAVIQRLNFVVFFEGEEWPMVLRFKKSSISAGKTLATMLNLHKGRKAYSFDSKEVKGDNGVYLVPVIKPAGDPDAQWYEAAKAFVAEIQERGVTVDEGKGGEDDEVSFP